MELYSLEAYEHYLEARNQSKVYIAYLKLLDKFIYELNIRLIDLTEEQFFNFLSQHKPKYSVETKNLFIKSLISYLKLNSNLSSPFLDKIKSGAIPLIKADVKIPKAYPSEEEIRNKVLLYLKNNKEKVIVEFLIASAIRANEFLKMKREDINLDEGIVKVLFGKGRKSRIAVIPLTVCNKVRELFAQEPEEGSNAFNFTSGKLRGLSRRVSQLLEQYITPHGFRHVGARELHRRGLSVLEVSRILGHSSIKTTAEIYLTQTNEQLINRYHSLCG